MPNVLRCSDEENLLLTEFSLEGDALIWWELMGCVHACDQVPINYEIFKLGFDKKYITNVARNRKAAEFAQLVQGQMLVTNYEAKFAKLSRYAPHAVDTEGEKACKFHEDSPRIPSQNKMAPLVMEDYTGAFQRQL